MKSITIHGIDKPLAEILKARAVAEGLSMNKTIKKLLEESLGIKPRPESTHLAEFEGFCGLWSETEKRDFENNTREMREIDAEDWK